MKFLSNPKVEEIIDAYPSDIRQKLYDLRQLVQDTASEIDHIEVLEETIKWGEPSYTTKGGSTLRMNWRKSTPDEYALYFICSTSLVETFKMIYGNKFSYEGTRAIIFHVNEAIPEKELKHCISLALTYHKVKHLPLLGA